MELSLAEENVHLFLIRFLFLHPVDLVKIEGCRIIKGLSASLGETPGCSRFAVAGRFIPGGHLLIQLDLGGVNFACRRILGQKELGNVSALYLHKHALLANAIYRSAGL